MGAHSSPRQSSSTSVTCQLSPGKKREKAETKRGRPRAPTKAGTPRQGPEAAGGGEEVRSLAVKPQVAARCFDRGFAFIMAPDHVVQQPLPHRRVSLKLANHLNICHRHLKTFKTSELDKGRCKNEDGWSKAIIRAVS